MATLADLKVKGLTGAVFFDKSTTPKTPYIVDTPGTAELDPGIEQLINLTRSELGEQVRESITIDSQQPIANLTFPSLTPTLLALRLNRKLENVSGTGTSAVEKRIRLTATNNTKTGATSGQEGNGMTADQAGSIAFVLSGLGIPTQLTRATHASFDPSATNDSFSQGADGAYKFSENLIGSDVQFAFPMSSQTYLQIGEAEFTGLEINFTIILRNLYLFRIEIPDASIDLSGSGNIPLGPGDVTLQVFPTYDGSNCTPINYKFLGQVRAC